MDRKIRLAKALKQNIKRRKAAEQKETDCGFLNKPNHGNDPNEHITNILGLERRNKTQ